jgi:hypothetical protein
LQQGASSARFEHIGARVFRQRHQSIQRVVRQSGELQHTGRSRASRPTGVVDPCCTDNPRGVHEDWRGNRGAMRRRQRFGRADRTIRAPCELRIGGHVGGRACPSAKPPAAAHQMTFDCSPGGSAPRSEVSSRQPSQSR